MLLLQLIICVITALSVTSQENNSNRCDTVRSFSLKTKCTNCRSNIRVKCPRGYRKTTRGRGRKGCRYRIGGFIFRSVRGCFHTCVTTRTEARCCDNYWGQDCQACPKGNIQNIVCSGRGLCFDGMNGNGTCNCRGNVVGSVCEQCALPTQYGPRCENECACVNGVCDSGVDRTGRCECNSGFGGPTCSIALLECANMNCHAHARCVNGTGRVECKCDVGYEGTGVVCTPINPCQNSQGNLCHQSAQCIHSGPGKYNCACREGYSGDGQFCAPVDPCQTNNGGCPMNTTICVYDGPGQSRCDCKPGYNTSASSDCLLVDVCGQRPDTTCDSSANCTTQDNNGNIGVVCSCPLGTVSRGLNCYSDILTEITKLNASGSYRTQLNLALEMFSSNYFDELSFRGPYTILVPIDRAFGSRGRPNNSIWWKTRARNHMVFGSVEVDFGVESASSMFPLLGYNSKIRALRPSNNSEEQFFATLSYNRNTDGHFLTGPKYTFNGLFYILDTFLDPPPIIENYDASGHSLLETIRSIPIASQFLSLWMKSFRTREWSKSVNFTLFLPTDDAFASLSDEEIKYLNGIGGLGALDTVLRHHFIIQPLSMTELTYSSRVQTSYDWLSVSLSDSGTMTIGNSQAKILISEILVNGGNYMYLIDRVLIPPSIEQLVISTCPYVQSREMQGLCGPCGRATSLCDNDEEVIIGGEASSCTYLDVSEESDGFYLEGCRYPCRKNTTIIGCCSGFYGPDCRSCPGPTHMACNHNGVCNDGRDGNGQCECKEGFQGRDCSICSRNFTFGPECNQNCTCINGVCNNTITSRGHCVVGSCDNEWAGEDCDRRSHPCGLQNIQCHQHAVCIEDDNNTESCICTSGFVGNGQGCIEYNPCEDSVERGGCHVDSWCLYHGKGNYTCTCMALFQGDGRTCDPINRCQDGSNNCGPNSDCLYAGPGQFQCKCLNGFQGNGIVCTEINSCLENNGGCHYRATCSSTGPGMNSCTCSEGYQGDGRICVGSLLVEINEHPQLSVIEGWTDSLNTVQEFFLSINYRQVTAFLPTNAAWDGMKADDYHFWGNRDHLPYLFRHHVVEGIVSTDKLRLNSVLKSMLPTAPITVTNVTDQIEVTFPNLNTAVFHRLLMNDKLVHQTTMPRLKRHEQRRQFTFTMQNAADNVTSTAMVPTLGKNHAKIIIPNLQTFSGLVHIIDSILLPPRDVVNNYSHLLDLVENSTGTPFGIFSLFLSKLNSSGIAKRINASQETYTIFALSNFQFDPSEVTSQMSHVLQYHVILGKIIRLNEFDSGQHEATMLGNGYQIALIQRHSTILVNGQEVVGEGHRTQYGIIHQLSSSLLTPIKNRCDGSTARITRSRCQLCSINLVCPVGGFVLGKIPCLIGGLGRLPSPFYSHSALYCKVICLVRLKQPECCPNFFGPECEPCPGGIGNICYKNGKCGDRMKGKGKCTCSSKKFSGIACDECAANYYGEDCTQTCICVNGVCQDGKSGSGSCVCNEGFTGTSCNKKKNPNDGCNGSCHSAATCRITGGCHCGVGYEGNGTWCVPNNPCKGNDKDINCHQYATCKYTGPGQHQCICKQGYFGDGVYCSEINPCLNESFPLCDPNALCRHTGPNQHNCICNEHYTGDGKSCQPINPCTSGPAKCHKFALCNSTGPDQYQCKCLSHYAGDGVNDCTGNAYIELIKRRMFGMIYNRPQVIEALTFSGPLTVFLPYKDLSTTPRQRPISFGMNNIVGCAASNTSRLLQLGRVYALDGSFINITGQQDALTLNHAVKLADDGKILSNGILYTTNGSLSPGFSSFYRMTEQGNLSDALNLILNNSDISRFYEILTSTNILNIYRRYQQQRSWTFFLPTNSAFRKLSPYKQRQLRTDGNVAQEYMRYHIVSFGNISPTSLIKMREVTTMQGSSISVSCSPLMNGQLVVNEGRALITRHSSYHISAGDGDLNANIFFINTVLQPPSVGGRCDVTNEQLVEGECGSCFYSNSGCPEGMQKIGQKKANCSVSYPLSSLAISGSILGCVPICKYYNVTRKCCEDFYGSDCHPCPVSGFLNRICSGRGKCDDGIGGSGRCRCIAGFRGVACELCEPGRFGGNCELCSCSEHGKCEEGVHGSGFCHCDQQWTGRSCDKKISHNVTCNVTCQNNAICMEDGRCRCKYGYVGYEVNGVHYCEAVDMCSYNPCSPHATCRTKGFTVFCACTYPYVGDGYICTGFDPCLNTTTAPKCHPLARCVYAGPNKLGLTRCQCPNGYHGDGVSSCVSSQDNPPAPKTCAINNGGCADEATCVETRSLQGSVMAINCTCEDGFAGDGYVCNGNIFEILQQGLFKTGRFYQKVVRKNYLYLIKLRQSSNMTLFVPSNNAMRSKRPNKKAFLRHIVSGRVYTEQSLRGTSMVVVDSGSALPVQALPDGSLYINGVQFSTTDIPATNGIIHVINGVIPKKISRVTTTEASAVSQTTTIKTTSKSNSPVTGLAPQSTNSLTGQPITKSTTTLSPPISDKASGSGSNPAKVGIAIGVILLILLVVSVVYWKRRSGMFVFRPLSERFGGSRSDEYEMPIGGSMDNPAYDSTAFREPTGEQDALIFSEDISTS